MGIVTAAEYTDKQNLLSLERIGQILTFSSKFAMRLNTGRAEFHH